jgi:hypothetical protein
MMAQMRVFSLKLKCFIEVSKKFTI